MDDDLPRPVVFYEGMGNYTLATELRREGRMSYIHDDEGDYDVWVQSDAVRARGWRTR